MPATPDDAPEHHPQRPFAVPPDATEVLLVRHGSTVAAVPGESFDIIDGHDDPPLAPEGHRQAERVADRLAGEGLGGLFVSGLTRTVQSAAPLAARLGLEPRAVPDLREVRLGDWSGGELRVRASRRDPTFLELLAAQRWDVIPGAEPMEGFAERVGRGFDAVVSAAGPGTRVAAVLHGGVIGEICRQVTGSRALAFVHADNGSITRVVVFATGHRLLRAFNDIGHL